jgi:hypothetical protein
LSQLLNEAGVQHREGRRCPECDAPLANQAVLCTNCGFNLEAGEKVEAATLSKKRARFRNAVLNEAVENMARDTTVDKRLKAAGMPWWVVLCLLLGGVILAGAGILIVDARSNEMQPAGTTFGELQRLPVGLFLLYVVMTISGMIACFAFLALTVSAFFESLKQGLLVLLVPMYVLYYCISRFKRYRGTAISFMGANVAYIAAWIVATTQY